MPIPTCKHQARKLFPLLVARMRQQSSMRDYAALCSLYLDVVTLAAPQEYPGPATREFMLEELQTELENQGI